VIVKAFEVRDEGTLIPVLAIKLAPHDELEKRVLDRAGYGRTPVAQSRYVMLIDIAQEPCAATTDPYKHGSMRTLRIAHEWIEKHFDTLMSGSVVCVEFILGERETPKESELQ
jgi:hypothetical protein